MNAKFKLTSETKTWLGRTLFRIEALISFGTVKAGDKGGFVEKEENISSDGNALVYGNAQVSGDAWVYGAGLALWIGGIGSRNGTTTFFACEDKTIKVVCGCFFGTIDEFSAAVEKTHGDNEHGRVYRLAIEMAKARILPHVHAAGDMEQAVQK